VNEGEEGHDSQRRKKRRGFEMRKFVKGFLSMFRRREKTSETPLLDELKKKQEPSMTQDEFFEFMTELHRGIFMPEKMCIDTEYGDTVTMKEYCHRRGIAMIGREDGTSVYIPEN